MSFRAFLVSLGFFVLLPLVAVAQPHSAGGSMTWGGQTVKVEGAVAYWDGNVLRFILLENPITSTNRKHLQDPKLRNAYLKQNAYGNCTIQFYGGSQGATPYTREDVAGMQFVVYQPPTKSHVGGPGGGSYGVSSLTGDFTKKRNNPVSVQVNYQGIRFQAECPVWAWGPKFIEK